MDICSTAGDELAGEGSQMRKFFLILTVGIISQFKTESAAKEGLSQRHRINLRSSKSMPHTPSGTYKDVVKKFSNKTLDNLKIEVVSERVGRGVFASRNIPKNIFVCDYKGQLYTKKDFESKMRDLNQVERDKIEK